MWDQDHTIELIAVGQGLTYDITADARGRGIQ
jgi:hypothetical protein